MSEESHASVYRKAVREAQAAERAEVESRRLRERRRDEAEKYTSYGRTPPKGFFVYIPSGSRMWYATDRQDWGESYYTRAAAVNAAWRRSGLAAPAGGKRRHAPAKAAKSGAAKKAKRRTLSLPEGMTLTGVTARFGAGKRRHAPPVLTPAELATLRRFGL